ncbi:transmembrane protein [Cystoisospora suis]|uniref:Transmembrane protein n=1 Tax=Cystoisospora suis TaxID=483139 RepID=A0A2C6KW84_9APIC|nr:transmembrane protein [Cystoisospora suis]
MEDRSVPSSCVEMVKKSEEEKGEEEGGGGEEEEDSSVFHSSFPSPMFGEVSSPLRERETRSEENSNRQEEEEELGGSQEGRKKLESCLSIDSNEHLCFLSPSSSSSSIPPSRCISERIEENFLHSGHEDNEEKEEGIHPPFSGTPDTVEKEARDLSHGKATYELSFSSSLSSSFSGVPRERDEEEEGPREKEERETDSTEEKKRKKEDTEKDKDDKKGRGDGGEFVEEKGKQRESRQEDDEKESVHEREARSSQEKQTLPSELQNEKREKEEGMKSLIEWLHGRLISSYTAIVRRNTPGHVLHLLSEKEIEESLPASLSSSSPLSSSPFSQGEEENSQKRKKKKWGREMIGEEHKGERSYEDKEKKKDEDAGNGRRLSSLGNPSFSFRSSEVLPGCSLFSSSSSASSVKIPHSYLTAHEDKVYVHSNNPVKREKEEKGETLQGGRKGEKASLLPLGHIAVEPRLTLKWLESLSSFHRQKIVEVLREMKEKEDRYYSLPMSIGGERETEGEEDEEGEREMEKRGADEEETKKRRREEEYAGEVKKDHEEMPRDMQKRERKESPEIRSLDSPPNEDDDEKENKSPMKKKKTTKKENSDGACILSISSSSSFSPNSSSPPLHPSCSSSFSPSSLTLLQSHPFFLLPPYLCPSSLISPCPRLSFSSSSFSSSDFHPYLSSFFSPFSPMPSPSSSLSFFDLSRKSQLQLSSRRKAKEEEKEEEKSRDIWAKIGMRPLFEVGELLMCTWQGRFQLAVVLERRIYFPQERRARKEKRQKETRSNTFKREGNTKKHTEDEEEGVSPSSLRDTKERRGKQRRRGRDEEEKKVEMSIHLNSSSFMDGEAPLVSPVALRGEERRVKRRKKSEGEEEGKEENEMYTTKRQKTPRLPREEEEREKKHASSSSPSLSDDDDSSIEDLTSSSSSESDRSSSSSNEEGEEEEKKKKKVSSSAEVRGYEAIYRVICLGYSKLATKKSFGEWIRERFLFSVENLDFLEKCYLHNESAIKRVKEAGLNAWQVQKEAICKREEKKKSSKKVLGACPSKKDDLHEFSSSLISKRAKEGERKGEEAVEDVCVSLKPKRTEDRKALAENLRRALQDDLKKIKIEEEELQRVTREEVKHGKREGGKISSSFSSNLKETKEEEEEEVDGKEKISKKTAEVNPETAECSIVRRLWRIPRRLFDCMQQTRALVLLRCFPPLPHELRATRKGREKEEEKEKEKERECEKNRKERCLKDIRGPHSSVKGEKEQDASSSSLSSSLGSSSFRRSKGLSERGVEEIGELTIIEIQERFEIAFLSFIKKKKREEEERNKRQEKKEEEEREKKRKEEEDSKQREKEKEEGRKKREEEEEEEERQEEEEAKEKRVEEEAKEKEEGEEDKSERTTEREKEEERDDKKVSLPSQTEKKKDDRTSLSFDMAQLRHLLQRRVEASSSSSSSPEMSSLSSELSSSSSTSCPSSLSSPPFFSSSSANSSSSRGPSSSTPHVSSSSPLCLSQSDTKEDSSFSCCSSSKSSSLVQKHGEEEEEEEQAKDEQEEEQEEEEFEREYSFFSSYFAKEEEEDLSSLDLEGLWSALVSVMSFHIKWIDHFFLTHACHTQEEAQNLYEHMQRLKVSRLSQILGIEQWIRCLHPGILGRHCSLKKLLSSLPSSLSQQYLLLTQFILHYLAHLTFYRSERKREKTSASSSSSSNENQSDNAMLKTEKPQSHQKDR